MASPAHVDSSELDTIPLDEPITAVRRRARPSPEHESLDGILVGLVLVAWTALVAVTAVCWAAAVMP